MPESTRRQIFWDLVATQDILWENGPEEEAPERVGGAYAIVARKYGITVESVNQIADEGLIGNWPMPPAP